MREISTRDRDIAFLVFGFLLACYLVTYTGTIQSSDGLSMFATVESMVRRGEIDSNQLLWMGLQQGSYGPDGELYSRKGMGMPLMALPLVWLANRWPSIGLVHTALLLNPILTAWTGALLFRTSRRFDWGRGAAIATSLTFGLATLAWPYTQTFFSDPVAAWGLFGAFYGMVSYRQTGRKRYLFLGGIAWGFAYLSRLVNLITLPVYLSLLVTVIVLSVNRPLRPDPLRNLMNLVFYNWRAMASFLLPVCFAGILSLWWNWLRYGNIWESGYLESETFSSVWLLGISGLLIGPARGLIWYAPVLLLAIPGAIWFWRSKRWVLITFIVIIVIFVLLYGKWYMWHGGFSWGPRFLVAILPFASLLAGPTFAYLLDPSRRFRIGLGIPVCLLILLSVSIQWLGMLAPFGLVQDWLAQEVQPLFAIKTFTEIPYSPLLLQWGFIRSETIPFGWWRGAEGGGIDWFGLMMCLSGMLVGVILILRQFAEPHDGSTLAFGQTPSARNWIYGGALIVLTLALLTHYRGALADPVQEEIARRITQSARNGDAILHLQPLATQEFANVYHGTLPTYGLTAKDSLDEFDQRWLAHLRDSHKRLWVVPGPGLPEFSGWERSLRTHDFLLEPGQSLRASGVRIPLYGMAQSQNLLEFGLGAIFGSVNDSNDPSAENGMIRLIGYAMLSLTKPGEEVYLVLRWESLKPTDNNYHVFVHVLDMEGDLIAQRDGQPVQWLRPINTWQPGEIIIDRYGLILPTDIEPGKYRISTGLYDPVSGARLRVNTGTIESAVELEPFQIVP